MLPSGCWRVLPNLHGIPAIGHNSSTLDEYKIACLNNNICDGIDWEPSNVRQACWILTEPYVLDITHTEVTHFRLTMS